MSLTQLVFESIRSGKIDKQVGAKILASLKQEAFGQHDEMAIIGMAAKLPQANSVDEYWENVKAGRDCITDFPANRQRDIEEFVQYTYMKDENATFVEGGYLARIDAFDYTFFGLSPKEAALMDPNQRMFLQTCWETIEDAGYGGKRLKHTRTGLFVGYDSYPMYGDFVSKVDPKSFHMSIVGNTSSIIASRLPFLLDLRGPSMLVDTACSSSLVALHTAIQSIQSGDCDQALVGGIKIIFLPVDGMLDLGIESEAFRAKAFDDNSDGTSLGEGSVAVMIKPLRKALRDKDHIYAVIKGSAINQDGASIGITAPNAVAQEDVILRAWKNARIDPETISYIEAHGTGTKLGDPIEIDGLQKAFRRYTDKRQFVAIGSAKTNVGHLDNVAGITGLVKAVLALQHKQLPPSLHFEKPNRKINFEESPLYVNDKLRPWDVPEGTPRRCGVSSFGLSGTNCHVILEEAPTAEADHDTQPVEWLTLSAKSPTALQELVAHYITYVQEHAEFPLESLCFTANYGRGHYSSRLALLVQDRQDLLAKLLQVQASGFVGGDDPRTYYGEHSVLPAAALANSTERQTGQVTESELREKSAQAQHVLAALLAEELSWEEGYAQLSELYVAGADIDFAALYEPRAVRSLRLPVYPFQPDRCWLIEPQPKQAVDEQTPFTYQTVWRKQDAPATRNERAEGAVLLLHQGAERAQALAAALRNQGHRVREAVLDTAAVISEEAFVISGSEASYQHLFEQLKSEGISQIVHLLNVDAGEVSSFRDLQDSQESGVHSLYRLTRGFLNSKWTSAVELVLVAPCVREVVGAEPTLQPEHASLFGLGKVIPYEYKHISCRALDVDQATSVDAWVDELHVQETNYHVAFRDGKRYVEVLNTLELPAANQPIAIEENGAYLITGGLGGIGLALAKHLAQQTPVKLVLLGRSHLPNRSEWKRQIASDPNGKTTAKLKSLLEIEDLGSEVHVYSVNIADPDAMQAAIAAIEREVGSIRGVFHGAGVAGNGFLMLRDPEAFAEVLLPKVEGTWLLHQYVRGADFFVNFSSVTGVFGGPGEGDYTAANSYLDAFSAYRNRQGGQTITINWPAWKETGMAVDHGVDESRLIFQALTTAQGIDVIERALQATPQNLMVGALHLGGPLYQMLDHLPLAISESLRGYIDRHNPANQKRETAAATPLREQKDISLSGKQDFSETEKQIASIWRDVLGYNEFNVHSNFFEIGGDSLLVTKVHELLEESYPGRLTVSELFGHPTIFKLARYLNEEEQPAPKALEAAKEAEIEEDILSMLNEAKKGNLSMEKALELFASLGENHE